MAEKLLDPSVKLPRSCLSPMLPLFDKLQARFALLVSHNYRVYQKRLVLLFP